MNKETYILAGHVATEVIVIAGITYYITNRISKLEAELAAVKLDNQEIKKMIGEQQRFLNQIRYMDKQPIVATTVEPQKNIFVSVEQPPPAVVSRPPPPVNLQPRRPVIVDDIPTDSDESEDSEEMKESLDSKTLDTILEKEQNIVNK